MNSTPTPNEPQPGAIPPSGETTPPPTDITPALDFYNRECSRLTLPEYIARRIKAFNPVEGMLLTEWQLAKLIALAIAEYEKATPLSTGGIHMTPPTPLASLLCEKCGKTKMQHYGSSFFCRIDSTENLDHFTPATEPEYRMLEEGEMIEEGDEVHRADGWGVITMTAGTHLGKACVGEYRRKLTPNEAQPEAPTP